MWTRCNGVTARHRRHDLSRGKAASSWYDCRRANGFRNGLDAANTAAGGTGDMAPPLVDQRGAGWPQPHPQFDAVVEFDNVETVDLVGGLHDAFAEAEADGEIAQILRRAHHDGVGAAIIGQRDCGLFRNRTACPGRRRRRARPAGQPCGRDRASLTPRLPRPGRSAASGGPARHRLFASRTGRSTARSAPPSPCIPGSWSPSRNSRW